MPDAVVLEALRRLDERLVAVCDEEERRATLLAGDGSPGWAGVRNLSRPLVADLLDVRAGPWTPLIPAGADSPLRRLGDSLQLQDCEVEAVLVVLAAHVEPRYQSVYAVLQDNLGQPRPTERLLFSVLGRDPQRRAVLSESLGPAGRLGRSGVLRSPAGDFPPLARPFELPEDMVAALLGSCRPPVPGASLQRWSAGTGGRDTDRAACVVVHGAGDRAGRAHELAGAGEPVLLVRVTAAAAVPVCRAAWRVGLVTGALPLLDLDDVDADVLPALVAGVVELAEDLGGRVCLLYREPLPVAVPHVEATSPSWAERREAWLDAARRRGVALTGADAARLAARHRFGPADVGRVFSAARTPDAAGLESAAAAMGVGQIRHSRRTVPTRTFDDLVLRDTTRDALDRLVYYVRHRDEVVEDFGLQRRFQLHQGPIALFAGRSGTGKSVAAETIAAALDRPLHTVNLAQLLDKYVGETEKHIDEVFSQAQRSSAVLFFDEADALFAGRIEKATGGSEHFANMLVAYLLQRIEQHDGLTILATNLRHGIDEAFLRRFQFRVEFPLPEREERRRIWELMLPESVKRGDDVDLARLAAAHRFAGGDIRNAALKALFIAHQRGEPVRHADLESAVALELLEMGRLSRRDGHVPASDVSSAGPDRGELLRACLDALDERLDDLLRSRFHKEIHLVHGSPTQERLAGKRPAVSLALYRIAARRGTDGLRAGFVVSTWSHRAEEEGELLGVVHESLSETALPRLLGRAARLRVQESHDFDLLHRFWSSHDHPVRASVVLDVEIE